MKILNLPRNVFSRNINAKLRVPTPWHLMALILHLGCRGIFSWSLLLRFPTATCFWRETEQRVCFSHLFAYPRSSGALCKPIGVLAIRGRACVQTSSRKSNNSARIGSSARTRVHTVLPWRARTRGESRSSLAS